METFLKSVAHDLFEKTGGELSRTAVIFPNKRAGLFFNEYLAKESERPLWSPAYLSISELFRQSSGLLIGDPVKLVCDLYRTYIEVTGSDEPLDNFYFWGEMMISDFDDADKNMADTDALFSNLKDLNDMSEGFDFMEDEQKEAISQFFHNFSIKNDTALKSRFTLMWNSLGKIYRQYKERLKTQGIAYEGMLYREVADSLSVEELPYERYVFVGFNVLNKVEHRLFSKLHDAGKAMFYWDYDVFYLKKPHEAGEFISRNLRDFPSELPPSCFDWLNRDKQIEFIESPTENGQARYLPQWIRENLTEPEKETAVVLCNESLLQPVLHSLPENIRHINITMGFPLSQTPAYSFVKAFVELHTEGYDAKAGHFLFAPVVSLLKHPYMQKISPHTANVESELVKGNRFYPLPSELSKDDVLEEAFSPCAGNLSLCERLSSLLKQIATLHKGEKTGDAYDQLYQEALFKAYTMTNRFRSLVEDKELDVKTETFRRLLVRVMSAASIPFHGEPAIGMQVMGVLETRNLDFRHLILLSVNEGQLPQSGGESSFIPYNLRKAFGLTTVDHKIAVYAYYFYRMIQRADKVTLMYNTATDGINRGEMSRFMRQLLIEWRHPIGRKQLAAEQIPAAACPTVIEKTPEIMERMADVFDTRRNKHALMSPTALNTYLDCPLKFYYKYVARLTAPDDVSADIDPAKFGSIFHYAAEHIYKDMSERQKTVDRETIERLLKDPVRLRRYVDNGFRELFFNPEANKSPQAPQLPEYNGTQLINSEVIYRYIRQLLRLDKEYTPFTFLDSEVKVREDITVRTPQGEIRSCIGGTIDRTDCKDNMLRIVDYKTGGEPEAPESVESLFLPARKRPHYAFQTFLYAAIMNRKMRDENSGRTVAPALLYIHRAASASYSPVIKLGKPQVEVSDFSIYEDEFRERLQSLLEAIFCADIAFTQTEVEDNCQYCDFKKLCKK
ncbi:PD-(D/E)XK nuclease family protein [Bacteroides gallinaceum]|uniref:PD-(D/E)XK nuclease family protein n=1 Tax=Bacteroides gallinaceum TaxID=1462571 RepID=UPI0025A3724A|nr:PD-(D/E)XK nuclease family protein [Bacteroides gallinaceum]MDM8208614.1 PD-(D/E)XK nuclease family protein [Bacteroides gallinaceum]